MNAAVRSTWRAGVIIACTAPSAAANIWPRVASMIERGVASGPEVGITAALVMSVAIMAAVPFAMHKASNVLEWLGYLVLGVGLAGFNFIMAMEVATHFRDSVTAPAALTAAKAATLNSRIEEATAALARLPQLPHTTAAQVSAAQTAVDTAARQAKEECGDGRGGRGPKCDLREAEQRASVQALAEVTANRAVSARREQLEDELRKARQELGALGVIPNEIDPTAKRIGEVLGAVFNLGERPDLFVIKWMPSFIAAVIEVIAMWGPRLILTATIGGGHVAPAPPRPDRKPDPAPVAAHRPAAPKPVPEPVVETKTATVARTPATPANPKKARKSKPAAVGDAASVREFIESRTTARPGSRIRCGEVYKAYQEWCDEQGISPVTLTRFGMEAKALGVGWDNRNNRPCYLDIALVGGLKVVAGGSRLGAMAKV